MKLAIVAVLAATLGGSNLGIQGYPAPKCTRPTEPRPPYLNNDFERRVYAGELALYKGELSGYGRCLQGYIENAQRDIDAIQIEIDRAARALSQIR